MNLTTTRNTTKYFAIKELSDENKTYSISALCEFAGIARSAYYKWLGHVNSDNDNLNERIADTITKIHDEYPDMGYRRIRDTLAHDYKIAVNDKRVLRICRKKKIQSYIKHRYNCCTKPASDPAYVAENILNREFKSDMINQKWVTDCIQLNPRLERAFTQGFIGFILVFRTGGREQPDYGAYGASENFFSHIRLFNHLIHYYIPHQRRIGRNQSQRFIAITQPGHQKQLH